MKNHHINYFQLQNNKLKQEMHLLRTLVKISKAQQSRMIKLDEFLCDIFSSLGSFG